jgi:hypothetical protein
MKKLLAVVLALGALAVLPECGRKKCCKKECAPQECPTVVAQNDQRVSGPLSEKEVGWDKEDFA